MTWQDRHLRMRRGAHQVLVNLGDTDWVAEGVGDIVLAWSPDAEVHDGLVDVPARSALVLRSRRS